VRKFKVIAQSVSGRFGKVYKNGDEIEESGFPINTVEGLLKSKYIEEINLKPMKNEDDGKIQKTATKKPRIK